MLSYLILDWENDLLDGPLEEKLCDEEEIKTKEEGDLYDIEEQEQIEGNY